MEQRPVRRALLLGAYGQTNLGDDVLQYNYMLYLRQQGFTHIDINAARADLVPSAITDEFDDIRLFEAYNTSAFQMIKLIRQADCIVYGGGTVYKELYATTGRGPYPLLIRLMVFNLLAKLLGKKIYHLHIGIGALKTRFGRWLSRRAILSATHTVFRDQQSYDFARDTLRIPTQKIIHSTDGLFLNPVWQKPWNQFELRDGSHSKDKLIVGINVLSDIPDWIDRKQYTETMAGFINELLADGHYVVLLPFQTGFNPRNDLVFIEDEIVPKLAKKERNYHVATDLALDTIISCLNQIDILVGMRLHGLLLATVAGTPFVGIAYDTKCWRYLQENDYSYAVKIEELSLEKLRELYAQAIVEKQHIRTVLKDISKRNFAMAEAWQKDFRL